MKIEFTRKLLKKSVFIFYCFLFLNLSPSLGQKEIIGTLKKLDGNYLELNISITSHRFPYTKNLEMDWYENNFVKIVSKEILQISKNEYQLIYKLNTEKLKYIPSLKGVLKYTRSFRRDRKKWTLEEMKLYPEDTNYITNVIIKLNSLKTICVGYKSLIRINLK